MKRLQFLSVKRFLSLLLAAALSFVPALSAAEGEAEADVGDVLAPNYIVVDANDPSTVFFEQNADESSIPGSTMKIMTCIVVLENCPDLSVRTTVSAKAARMKDTNSLMEVIAGEDLSIEELLYGLMLESGNDAAITLAIHVGGSVEGFAEMMNAKAAAIGMSEVTHFVNASGAYKSGGNQFSTARDMAILACYALQNETFRKIVATARYTVPPNTVREKPLVLTNSNRLVSDAPEDKNSIYCAYCDGVKTGSTELGGKCLVTSATRADASIVCVMLGAKEGGSKNQRMNRVFKDSKRLLELTLETQFAEITPAALALAYTDEILLPDGSVATIEADFSAAGPVRLRKAQADALIKSPETAVFTPAMEKGADVLAVGDPCGSLAYAYAGRTLFTVPLRVTAITAPLPAETPAVTATPDASPVPAATADATAKAGGLSFLLPLLAALIVAVAALLLFSRLRKGRRKR